ncbi:MAG: hypothetical protein ACTS44_00985 [Candidatus Hodgkinia cicadicola]
MLKRNEIERSPTQQTTFQHFRFKQTSVQFKLLINLTLNSKQVNQCLNIISQTTFANCSECCVCEILSFALRRNDHSSRRSKYIFAVLHINLRREEIRFRSINYSPTELRSAVPRSDVL